MGRAPLPIGTWGKIRVYGAHVDSNGKPDTFRAMANYRDFDGKTRTVESYGKSRTVAAHNLGHARPSMTQDVYMGRKVLNRRAADALESLAMP
jgi:integrase